MSGERTAQRKHSAWPAALPGLVIAAAVGWAAATTAVAWDRLGEAGPRIWEFLGRMLPPDASVMPEVARGLAETMRIAILGTLGCVLASLVLGPLASERLAPSWVHRPVRSMLAVLKVFIVDLSNLEGIMRAFSFIGLGLTLIGIALVYQRLLARRPGDASPA